MTDTKTGRGRRYDWPPAATVPVAELAELAGALDELLARHADLVGDLPAEALVALPAGLGSHLAGLTRHMAWAEAHWMCALAGRAVPAELDAALSGDGADGSAAALLSLCQRVRAELTQPILAGLHDAEAVIDAPDGRRLTPRRVLRHLLWHWTYHGGQCGLLRRLSGRPYRWTFDEHAFTAAGSPSR